MKNFQKKVKEALLTIDRRTYRILTTIDQDPYPDDGCNLDKNGLYGFKRRQFKSWKNYRNKQYKL